MNRGLRQGDPLPLFLFLLAAKDFNLMMSKEVQLNRYEEYQFGKMELMFHIYKYAEDTLIVGKET